MLHINGHLSGDELCNYFATWSSYIILDLKGTLHSSTDINDNLKICHHSDFPFQSTKLLNSLYTKSFFFYTNVIFILFSHKYNILYKGH